MNLSIFIRLETISATIIWCCFVSNLDKGAFERWLPPYGFNGSIDPVDGRLDGGYQMSFTNFGTGSSHSFKVRYTQLVTAEHIQYVNTFDYLNLPGEMIVTVDLKPVLCGIDKRISQTGIPAIISEERCYLGWQESIDQLIRLVEPDIPDSS